MLEAYFVMNETNLTAALTPKDAITVQPNMFVLQIKNYNMRVDKL
jgi:hypothetical protein